MPFKHTSWFGRKGQPNRRSEEFTIYKVGEKCPEYWTIKDWKRIHEIEIGEYVETIDGYISPVIKINTNADCVTRTYFRIANKSGYAFRFAWVSQGKQEIYFDPPRGYFVSHLAEPTRITRSQRRFAWAYAKHGDIVKAMDESFAITNVSTKNSHGRNLLKRKIVQEAVSEAFRKQIELAQADENSFVITRMKHTQDKLEEILDTITKKVKKGEISTEDVEVLNSVLTTSKELMASNAELLGYKGQSDEFSLQLKGKRTFNYELPPVETKYEEIRTEEE